MNFFFSIQLETIFRRSISAAETHTLARWFSRRFGRLIGSQAKHELSLVFKGYFYNLILWLILRGGLKFFFNCIQVDELEVEPLGPYYTLIFNFCLFVFLGFSPVIGTFLKQEQAPQSLLECTSKVNLNHIVFFKK